MVAASYASASGLERAVHFAAVQALAFVASAAFVVAVKDLVTVYSLSSGSATVPCFAGNVGDIVNTFDIVFAVDW